MKKNNSILNALAVSAMFGGVNGFPSYVPRNKKSNKYNLTEDQLEHIKTLNPK